MSTYLEDILKKLGWEDGFQIPVANAENQKLEEEVARLTLQKVKEKTACETSTIKLENLENHLKYVAQECEQIQNLITAHAQQLQSEENKLKISRSEKDKYECDIRESKRKIASIRERQLLQINQLEQYTKKLDKLKLETDWDTEALKAWEESLQKRGDDNELIKRFSKQDDRKYKELDARRQNLELEYANRKQIIEQMVSDLTNYERMLERTGKIIHQQIIERNALIRQWKDSVKILHQRDNDIDRIQVQILDMQEIIEKEQVKLEEHKLFHDNEVRNNTELQHDTQQMSFLNAKMRRELNELVQNMYLLSNQADTLRRTMIRMAHLLEKERRRKYTAQGEIEKAEDKIMKYREVLNVLREKYEDLKQTTASADERTKQLEKYIDYEQKQQKALQADTEMQQNAFFRAQHDLQEQFNTGKLKDLEIYGVTNNINHLRKHNDDQRKALGKKKEDAYDLDYKIDEVQRKILINENVIHDEDTEVLEVKLLDLETKMGEHSEVKNLLKDQVNKIRDDMRRLTTAIVADQSQLGLLKDKLQHQNLSYEGGQKQSQVLKRYIQEKQVEENILRLRVNQLNKAMRREEKSIYTMQKFKLNLEQATKERILEIETNKEILFVKRRSLVEDKGRLKCDITERRIRLEQFIKKYDMVLATLGKDEDGQTYTVTHFKIKNAQEKFLMQQQGDHLDTNIKKAEQEILAMENTLKVVNLTNAAFKHSLAPVDEQGNEENELKILEDEMLMVNDLLRANRKKLAAKRQEVEEIEGILNDLEIKQSDVKDRLLDLEDEYLKIEKEKALKEEKLKRAEHCLRLVQKKITSKERERYDRDLEIRQLRDANVSVLQRLVDMSIQYQDVAPLITRYTIEYEVDLPKKRTLSTLSTSTESTRSTPSCSRIKKSARQLSSESSERSESSGGTTLSKIQLTFRI